jgi:hypothetical protein
MSELLTDDSDPEAQPSALFDSSNFCAIADKHLILNDVSRMRIAVRSLRRYLIEMGDLPPLGVNNPQLLRARMRAENYKNHARME